MKLSEILNEANGRRGYGWSLLPATSALWNKQKVGLKEVGEEWKNETVYIATDKTGKIKFLCSSGPFKDVKVGDVKAGYHDQTFRDLGNFTIVNIVTIKDGKVSASDNDKHLEDKAPVLVFK